MENRVIEKYNVIFWNFVNNYDTSNTNILRKIIHTFAVAETCFAISSKLGLCEEERNFAYLVGLFHDLGRFEQWKLYGTYNDKESVDHAILSAEIIEKFDEKDLFITKKQKTILCKVVALHNKPYDKECENFNYVEIIKNADSYCNIITVANGAQCMTVDKDGVTPEILDDFCSRLSLCKYNPLTKLDRCLILCSVCYNITFDFLREDIYQKNYIKIMCETFSKYLNNKDKKMFKQLMEDMENDYLQCNNSC